MFFCCLSYYLYVNASERDWSRPFSCKCQLQKKKSRVHEEQRCRQKLNEKYFCGFIKVQSFLFLRFFYSSIDLFCPSVQPYLGPQKPL